MTPSKDGGAPRTPDLARPITAPTDGATDAPVCKTDADCPAGFMCVASGSGEFQGAACVPVVDLTLAPQDLSAPIDSTVVDLAPRIDQTPSADLSIPPDLTPAADLVFPCSPITVSFNYGTHAAGPCTLSLPRDLWAANWALTNKTDDYVGGLSAQCVGNTWVISNEHCAPRNGATTCFSKGTRCDGSGPAIFPYEHCFVCCNQTDPVPGVCN